jgi:hypothetical protein
MRFTNAQTLVARPTAASERTNLIQLVIVERNCDPGGRRTDYHYVAGSCLRPIGQILHRSRWKNVVFNWPAAPVATIV